MLAPAERIPIMLGPAPCDTCRHIAHCRQSGDACRAFAAFVDNRAWDFEPREPRADIGRRLGI